MLLSVRIYTHPRGDEMDEEGGELVRALSPITNKEQKSMTGSECDINHNVAAGDRVKLNADEQFCSPAKQTPV